jgi:hypothetical protein
MRLTRSRRWTLDELVGFFLAQHPELTMPSAAFQQCVARSREFAELVAEHGFRPVIVHCEEFIGELSPHAYERWIGENPQMFIHHVVRVGGRVFDWTARQFDAYAEVPLIGRESDLSGDWRLVEPLRRITNKSVTLMTDSTFLASRPEGI